jgi:hypothetical protein
VKPRAATIRIIWLITLLLVVIGGAAVTRRALHLFASSTARASDGGSGAFTSSPWAYNGKIFCLDEEGATCVVKAGATFEALHVNSQDEMALATPAIAGDRLLLRTETKLYSIRRK